ncbi:hypothetical protein AEM38_14265 [Hyphomonadaceae bacterium UKL13-1]|nr:hypothetical protein AEM38_14265 [Hyphomonadaceae bacterium UKL13-1]
MLARKIRQAQIGAPESAMLMFKSPWLTKLADQWTRVFLSACRTPVIRMAARALAGSSVTRSKAKLKKRERAPTMELD